MRVVMQSLWCRLRFVDLKAKVFHHLVIEILHFMEVPDIARRRTSNSVVVRVNNVIVKMTAVAVGVGCYNNVSVRREPTREFQTCEMRELNIEGVICRKFIRVKTLNFNFSFVNTLGVP